MKTSHLLLSAGIAPSITTLFLGRALGRAVGQSVIPEQQNGSGLTGEEKKALMQRDMAISQEVSAEMHKEIGNFVVRSAAVTGVVAAGIAACAFDGALLPTFKAAIAGTGTVMGLGNAGIVLFSMAEKVDEKLDQMFWKKYIGNDPV